MSLKDDFDSASLSSDESVADQVDEVYLTQESSNSSILESDDKQETHHTDQTEEPQGSSSPTVVTVEPRRQVPVGDLHQADLSFLDDPEACEINDDYAGELVWDPTQLSDDTLGALLEHCKVGSPSYLVGTMNKSHQDRPSNEGSRLRGSSSSSLDSDSVTSGSSLASRDGDDDDDDTETQVDNYHFEHYKDVTRIVSEQIQRGEPVCIPHDRDDVLSLEDMLQVIHDSDYNLGEILQMLHSQRLRGWHTLRPKYQRWKRHEIELFELAMSTSSNPKNFPRIQSIVQTRSVEECVEYYYAWKHTPAHHAFLNGSHNKEESDMLPSFGSRQLPSFVAPSSKKRKRDEYPSSFIDHPAGLICLDSFGNLANDHMLNILLDSPSCLVEDATAPSLGTEEPQSTISLESLIEVPKLLATMSPKRPKLHEGPETLLSDSILLPASHTSTTITISPADMMAHHPQTHNISSEPAGLDFFM